VKAFNNGVRDFGGKDLNLIYGHRILEISRAG